MNFSILYNGRMSNQLVLLYHIYNTYDKINKIYSPFFDKYAKYFNINKLCDSNYYLNNIETFNEIRWNDNINNIVNYCDSKFNELKLKPYYDEIVREVLKNFQQYDNLISVHIRQTDFKDWHDGCYYFDYDYYMKKCFEKIKEWDIKNYKILIFSDEKQNISDDNSVFISDITNFEGPLDLFIMSNCNYFISTWSTFSLMAINISTSMNKFKKNYIIEK